MENKLRFSKSPYLLQHKDNPVHWNEWSVETLQRARQENKIIIVSIGYSTCHWCHVMAHECFEDESIAQIMNQYFINIKIDREERPDLDHYFMSAIQMMGISGGWPLNCFMTPDQKVFYGGTYFPPVSKYGRISWPDLLGSIQNSFTGNHDKLIQQANNLSEVLKQQLSTIKFSKMSSAYILSDSLKSLESFIDKEFGGLGFGQKFPNTMALEYLITANKVWNKNKYSEFINLSIKNLCLGGMYDHIQGGFFRYTVDRQWKVPHFEKMAYDHALILNFLSRVCSFSKNHYASYFIKKSFQFWEDEMKSSTGLFYAALDADSEGEEGLYYLWTENELKNQLSQQSSQFFNFVQLEELHGSHKKVFNLFGLNSIDESQIVNELKDLHHHFSVLQNYRSARERPSTDFKLILSWNSLIITAYCRAYLANIDESYKVKVIELLDILLQTFESKDVPFQYYRIASSDSHLYQSAFLDDYAYLAEAIFLIYQITGDEKYFNLLMNVIGTIEKNFDQKSHIFSYNSKSQNDQFCTSFDLTDSSIPNPNAKLAELYYFLSLKTNEIKYFEQYNNMLNTSLSAIGEQYYSHISWLQLHPDLMKNKKALKAKDWATVSKFSESLDRNNFYYIYTEDMKINEVQLCTQEVCLIPSHTVSDFIQQIESMEI